MSDESLCYGTPKPKFPPSYYTTHNITPSRGNDWVCRTSGWEWQQTAEEKVASAVVEKKLEDLPYSEIEREMYGSIVVDKEKYLVHIDSMGRDFIYRGNELCYLNKSWWTTRVKRSKGETQIKECKVWKTSGVGVFGGGDKWEPPVETTPELTGDCPRGRQYQAPLIGGCDPGYYRQKKWGRDMCICEAGASAETSFDKLGAYLSGNLKMVLIVIVVIVIGLVVMQVASKKVSVG